MARARQGQVLVEEEGRSPALGMVRGARTARKPLRAGGQPILRFWRLWWNWITVNTFLPARLAGRGVHPATGYLLAVLFPVGAALVDILLVRVMPGLPILGPLELLGVTLVALSWGAGPSLCATLVGALLLHVVVALPYLNWSFHPSEEVTGLLLFVFAGAAVSIVASQTERARRDAQEANRRTDEFTSIVSHELRQPLTSIVAALQLSERRLARARPAPGMAEDLGHLRELLETSRYQAGVLNRLIDDLLDVSRIQSSKLELRLTSCDLVAIVRAAVEAQRLAWPTRLLSLDAPAEPLRVLVDADRIGQVVTNYLTNALKYSADDRPVRVTISAERGLAYVAVHDQGPGLPPGEQSRVWNRFHRAAGVQVQSGTGVGLGLGLHICRTIIHRHHGSVGVQSVPRMGSTFWFTLPLRPEAATSVDVDAPTAVPRA